jgi:hypothetical protein
MERSASRPRIYTEAGESVDYFYRSGTQMELEEALACWLRKQIKTEVK